MNRHNYSSYKIEWPNTNNSTEEKADGGAFPVGHDPHDKARYHKKNVDAGLP